MRFAEELFAGYRWYVAWRIAPLFPFGHGLSYTSFDYADLTDDKPVLRDTDTLEVSLTVRNTGDRAGREVVQLYLRERAPRWPRPEKELKAFAKVALEPGEAQVVRFRLGERVFAFYDPRAGAWATTSGVFDLLVGASSRDIRLSASVTLEAAPSRPTRLDRLSPIADWLAHPVGSTLIEGPVAEVAAAFGGDAATGGSPMLDAFVGGLPVGKLVVLGVLGEEELARLIAAANEGADGPGPAA